MLSTTREHLARLDNQHAFERLAADVLNHLDRSLVEPIAPGGGSDGGVDLLYIDKDGNKGVGLVTLRKDIARKFQSDLARLRTHAGELTLFCNVDVSPKQKEHFQQLAARIGSSVIIFDLERLRSILDTSLQGPRQTYLRISHDHLNSPRTLASTIETKLILSFDPNAAGSATTLRLIASAPKDQLVPVYSVTVFVEEHARLFSDQLELLAADAFVARHGRKRFSSIHRKIVSPSFGHPIWHGVDIDLIGLRNRIDFNQDTKWSELLIVSELHAPGLSSPIVNHILTTRSNDGSMAYHYSHERNA